MKPDWINIVSQLALSFPEATEEPHFEKTSFRVKKKIFATLDIENLRLTVKLSEIDQSAFCAFDRSIVYPVENKWGKQGWTIVELSKATEELISDILKVAYQTVAPPKLAAKM